MIVIDVLIFLLSDQALCADFEPNFELNSRGLVQQQQQWKDACINLRIKHRSIVKKVCTKLTMVAKTGSPIKHNALLRLDVNFCHQYIQRCPKSISTIDVCSFTILKSPLHSMDIAVPKIRPFMLTHVH